MKNIKNTNHKISIILTYNEVSSYWTIIHSIFVWFRHVYCSIMLENYRRRSMFLERERFLWEEVFRERKFLERGSLFTLNHHFSITIIPLHAFFIGAMVTLFILFSKMPPPFLSVDLISEFLIKGTYMSSCSQPKLSSHLNLTL